MHRAQIRDNHKRKRLKAARAHPRQAMQCQTRRIRTFGKKQKVKKKAELSSAQVQQGGMKRCERTRLFRLVI